ncbi:MAG: hypothetical protein FWG15_02515 [Propionibacteriaceae bacterium]|nr:hypothetical protein [Propionibacteriaceae bacterium]
MYEFTPGMPAPKKPTKMIILVVTLSIALTLVGITLAIFLPGWLKDEHGCPPGYFWGYGGNPMGMTEEEIEAASSCLKEGLAYKPIIYLYPNETTIANVTLSHPENLTVSYPQYDSGHDGWTVRGEPNGDLFDFTSGTSLYALFYESTNNVNATVHHDGFIVPGADTATFLEEKLTELGLNPRESQEFIIYWLPILQESQWNYIRFQPIEEIEANQELIISPTPDTVIRVMMSYLPLDSPIDVTEQNLGPAPVRTGFTVVEWGGTRISI